MQTQYQPRTRAKVPLGYTFPPNKHSFFTSVWVKLILKKSLLCYKRAEVHPGSNYSNHTSSTTGYHLQMEIRAAALVFQRDHVSGGRARLQQPGWVTNTLTRCSTLPSVISGARPGLYMWTAAFDLLHNIHLCVGADFTAICLFGHVVSQWETRPEASIRKQSGAGRAVHPSGCRQQTRVWTSWREDAGGRARCGFQRRAVYLKSWRQSYGRSNENQTAVFVTDVARCPLRSDHWWMRGRLNPEFLFAGVTWWSLSHHLPRKDTFLSFYSLTSVDMNLNMHILGLYLVKKLHTSGEH